MATRIFFEEVTINILVSVESPLPTLILISMKTSIVNDFENLLFSKDFSVYYQNHCI